MTRSLLFCERFTLDCHLSCRVLVLRSNLVLSLRSNLSLFLLWPGILQYVPSVFEQDMSPTVLGIWMLGSWLVELFGKVWCVQPWERTRVITKGDLWDKKASPASSLFCLLGACGLDVNPQLLLRLPCLSCAAMLLPQLQALTFWNRAPK